MAQSSSPTSPSFSPRSHPPLYGFPLHFTVSPCCASTSASQPSSASSCLFLCSPESLSLSLPLTLFLSLNFSLSFPLSLLSTTFNESSPLVVGRLHTPAGAIQRASTWWGLAPRRRTFDGGVSSGAREMPVSS